MVQGQGVRLRNPRQHTGKLTLHFKIRGMCVGIRVDWCVNMHVDMRVDTFLDMCIDKC